MHCPNCNCERKGDFCWKCSEALIVPCDGWAYPLLPDVTRIRELAKEVGYAIGEHGSKERDLDLIAAPWTEDAIGNYALLEHIAKGMNAKILTMEWKPFRRFAATMQIDGYVKPIDISVMPRGEVL